MVKKINRRDFAKGAVAGTCLAAFPSSLMAFSRSGGKIGIQLWCIRDICNKDMDKGLDLVKEMGFEGVEFAGFGKYQKDLPGLKKKLEDTGLKVCGSHIPYKALSKENINRTIETYKAIDCDRVIVGSCGDILNPKKIKEAAEVFVQAAETLKAQGMACGFHNHQKEFGEMDGKTFWDVFAESTNDDVILELDIGWALLGGQNPAELIRKYPGRVKLAHFRPVVAKGAEGKQGIIGQDSVDWKDVITACREAGKTEWYIIEQGKGLPGKSSSENVDLSLKGLKEILAGM